MLKLRSRGQSLAEFALVLPIFLLIVMALFDLGRGVFIYNGLTNAAREGARLAIVNQDKTLVAQRAQDMAFGTEVTNTPAALVNFFRSGPNTDNVEANPPCDNSDASHAIAVGCIAVVKAQASWQAITPIIGDLIGPINLEARSELAIELVCPNSAFPAYAPAAPPDSPGANCPRQP
jgi:Flp pilus assembly protein TadG